MGIQHFIDGYFSGKVGVFVGAKWKNIKTLRSLGVWLAPPTNTQKVIMSDFKRGIVCGQWSMNINPYSPIWYDERLTVWNMKTSVSIDKIKAGHPMFESFALVPQGYINYDEPNIINVASGTGTITLTINNTAAISQNREMVISVILENISTKNPEIFYTKRTLEVKTTNEETTSITINYDNRCLKIYSSTWICGATIDDKTHGNRPVIFNCAKYNVDGEIEENPCPDNPPIG